MPITALAKCGPEWQAPATSLSWHWSSAVEPAPTRPSDECCGLIQLPGRIASRSSGLLISWCAPQWSRAWLSRARSRRWRGWASCPLRRAGAHVALAVADKPALVLRRRSASFAASSTRRRMRLWRGGAVTTDHGGWREGAVPQQFVDHRLGQPRVLLITMPQIRPRRSSAISNSSTPSNRWLRSSCGGHKSPGTAFAASQSG